MFLILTTCTFEFYRHFMTTSQQAILANPRPTTLCYTNSVGQDYERTSRPLSNHVSLVPKSRPHDTNHTAFSNNFQSHSDLGIQSQWILLNNFHCHWISLQSSWWWITSQNKCSSSQPTIR